MSGITITTSPADRGRRLDLIISECPELSGVSRAKIQAGIKNGGCSVNGRTLTKPSARMDGGEIVVFDLPGVGNDLAAEEGEIDVLYEDENLLVLDKAAGISVHPSPSEPEGTLVHRLISRYPHLSGLDSERPGIVHRLDKNTSGLMIVALNEATRLKLAGDFAARLIDKTYLAVVLGTPPDEGEINLPIGRHPHFKTRNAVLKKGGKEALSFYKRLVSVKTRGEKTISLLEVKIATGRTHQIRVHLSHIGHPILGDSTYGTQELKLWEKMHPLLARLTKRQALHAWKLSFTHPESGEKLSFVRTPPADFTRLIPSLRLKNRKLCLIGMPGSGKTVTLNLLAEAGIAVFSADKAVADAYRKGADGYLLLKGRFGDVILDPESGEIDRRKLLASMMASDAVYREVMDLVHPLVWHALDEFFRKWRDVPLVAAEIPLLLECGKNRKVCDFIAGIWSPHAVRMERLRKRGLGDEAIAWFESRQWPEKDKLGRTDFIIENPGDMDGLKNRVKTLISLLAAISRQRTLKLVSTLEAIWHGDDPAEKSETCYR